MQFIHKTCETVPLPISVTLSIFIVRRVSNLTVRAFTFLTLSANTPFSLLSFHNVSSSVPSNSLDIQHCLKASIIAVGEMHCHALIKPLTNRNHNMLLDSSNGFRAWYRVTSHSLYSCFKWSLNGLFTTPNTCSCAVIPLV